MAANRPTSTTPASQTAEPTGGMFRWVLLVVVLLVVQGVGFAWIIARESGRYDPNAPLTAPPQGGSEGSASPAGESEQAATDAGRAEAPAE
jgi:hypothetical protein